jgi:hypothetical protein
MGAVKIMFLELRTAASLKPFLDGPMRGQVTYTFVKTIASIPRENCFLLDKAF